MRQIMVVDDDRAMRELLVDSLSALGFEVHPFAQAKSALEYLRAQPIDTVLTDVRMPGITGLELCGEINKIQPDLPVIVLTGFGSLDVAVQAIRAGAYDFLSKPVGLDSLEIAVKRAVDHHRLTSEIHELREAARRGHHGMIGESPAFKAVMAQVPKAGRSDVSVLIQGETGTGKELLARALHVASSRRDAPFVAVNCAAIPESLVESELFGHVRGAFTDARSDRGGLFAEAGQGTLFLDEVGELPPSVQPKLLRALQEMRVRAVGSDRDRPVACRVLSASNTDMLQDCADKRFRSDLYYRLAVIRLVMPPLRERGSDILALAEHFIAVAAQRMGGEVAGLSTEVARILLSYGWPGNVRELENAMERGVIMSETALISPHDLPDEIARVSAVDDGDAALRSMEEVERAHIVRVLAHTDGNKKAAAEILQLDRRTLYRKLERWEAEGQ